MAMTVDSTQQTQRTARIDDAALNQSPAEVAQSLVDAQKSGDPQKVQQAQMQAAGYLLAHPEAKDQVKAALANAGADGEAAQPILDKAEKAIAGAKQGKGGAVVDGAPGGVPDRLAAGSPQLPPKAQTAEYESRYGANAGGNGGLSIG